MHETLTVAIPLIAIIAGILFNRSDFQRLSNDVQRVNDRLDAVQAEMHREFREFYRTLGQHDARLDHLDRK